MGDYLARFGEHFIKLWDESEALSHNLTFDSIYSISEFISERSSVVIGLRG